MVSRFSLAASALAILLTPVGRLAAGPQPSPLETIEQLHTALRNADPKVVDSLLHEEYHGEWEVRILSSSTQIDPNGMAHVWARYVFYFKGKPNHCGRESYDLYQSEQVWKVVSFADTDNPLNGKSVDEVCPAR